MRLSVVDRLRLPKRLPELGGGPAMRSAWFSAAAGIAVVAMSAVVWGAEEHICRFCQQWHQQQDTVAWDNDPAASGRHYAPDRQVDVLHIGLDVTPDFKRHTVSGEATLVFQPISQPLEVLRLDAVHLDIQEVVASGARVVDHTSTTDELLVHFQPPVPVGQRIKLTITYQAEPAKGLYFRTPDMGYAPGDTHLWTQGEPHEARHWFPCFDYPNERSSTSIICHVPPEMTVLSNGALVGEKVDEATGLKAVHWHQETPHVNYLICLVAGYLEKLEKKHRDVPLAFYTQPSTIEYAANSFADTDDIMAFFEEEIGVSFPWKKYSQVTIVDFMWGGMENTTITTLTHNTLFDKATENLRTTRRLDAHEMAHQWFGDYLTCKDWSHLWLNEGFATYYTHLYEGHHFGRDAMLYGLYNDAKHRILTQGQDTKPIVYKQYAAPQEQFDYRSYPKGSWVLHMLRSQLGESLYRECIKTYVERHALTSVVTEDLNSVIEEVTGRSFDPFFDQWVYHARHPDIKVRYRWLPDERLAHVTVEQTQDTNDDVLLFQFPVTLRFWVDGAAVDHEVHIDARRQEFHVPLAAEPTAVRFDPEYTVLADVTFDKPDALLYEQLANTSDVIGRILAVEQLGKRKTQKAIETLSEVLAKDSFFGVRREAARALTAIDDDAAYEALVANRDQADARVRQAVLQGIARKYSDQTRRLLLDVVATESNPEIVGDSLRALGSYSGEDVREALLGAMRQESFRNEIADAAIAAARRSRDATFVGPLLRVLASRREQFTTRGLANALETLAELSQERVDKRRVREFLLDHVSHPRDNIRVAAIRALGKLGDAQAAGALQALADDQRHDRIAQAAKDALKQLDETSPTAPREVVELRGELRKLQDEQQQLRDQLRTLESKFKAQADGTAKNEAGKNGSKSNASSKTSPAEQKEPVATGK